MSFTYSVQQLKGDLERKLHGTTLNQITNINSLIQEAASILLLDVDPQETKRTVELVNALYTDVTSYQSPVDLKGNKIIQIFPQAINNNEIMTRFTQIYNEDFTMLQNLPYQANLSINFNNGIKFLQLRNTFSQYPGHLVNAADSVTGNGTWVTGGTATDLTEDRLTYISNNAALRFNLSLGANPSNGYIENSTMDPVDLTTDKDYGAEFVYVFLPQPQDVISIRLRWGSSSSDYWESTVTTTQDQTSFRTGWNLLRFDWINAIAVGNPDVTSVSYLRLDFNYTGTELKAIRVNNFVSRIGRIYMMEYYSKYLFQDAVTGAFQESVTDDTNIINLDTETYNLFLELTAVLCFQQQAGRNGRFDIDLHSSLYAKALKRYRQMYKSEINKPRTMYYPTQRRANFGVGPHIGPNGLMY